MTAVSPSQRRYVSRVLFAACHIYQNLYTSNSKDLEFRGNSLDDLRRFPLEVIREAGHQLDCIQNNRLVSDVKPMKQIGGGVLEIRLWSEQGTFRVIYVSKLRNVVYVLHCFQKKSQATAQADINVAVSRYKSLLRELGL